MENKPLIVSKTGVKIQRGLFTPDVVNRVSEFMNDGLKFTPIFKDDVEFKRTYANNVPFFVNLHHQLTDYACEQFGEKVKPSYSFLSMYYNGGTCPLHIDRQQCRYTIDYLISKSDETPWPIDISHPMDDDLRLEYDTQGAHGPSNDEEKQMVIDGEKWTRVELQPNDAVLYSGTHSWHYRPTILTGSASLVFFHFVREDFNGPLN